MATGLSGAWTRRRALAPMFTSRFTGRRNELLTFQIVGLGACELLVEVHNASGKNYPDGHDRDE